MAPIRIFFATDIHGSDKCWKKFVNAGKFYKADILILGGDMTGKAIVPIIKQNDGTYKCSFLGQELVMRSAEEVSVIEKMISDSGYYPYHTNPKEMEEMGANPKRQEELFLSMAIQRMREWIKYADERLKGTGIKCFVCPGNDDPFEIESVIQESESVVNVESKIIKIADRYEMISTGWTNPTPWKTYKECSEEELFKKLEKLISQVENLKNAIFNLHAPPYGSGLDEAPELDKDLRIKHGGRALVPVGSTAVREIILKHQPLLGLHGHIHESVGECRLGRTLCLNPGSQYEQGILMGYIVDLDDKGIKRYFRTSG